MGYGFKISSANLTAFNLVSCWFEETLNGITTWEFGIDGAGANERTEFDVNSTIIGYYNGTLVMTGTIRAIDAFSGGGRICRGMNREVEFAEKKCPIDAGKHTKTWTSSNANTIFSALVTEMGAPWTADVTGSTATSIAAFRVNDSMSLWEGIISVIKHTQKDIYVDKANNKMYLKDKQGTADKFHFVEGSNIGQIFFKTNKPQAAKVVVYGKGDGTQQITGSSGSGTPVLEVIDRNILTTAEANARAVSELALISSSLKNYTFLVYDTSLSLAIGDQGKLTAPSVGLNDEAIDIVRLKRGVNDRGIEYLEIEVTNASLRVAMANRSALISKSEKNLITSQSAMQGGGNLSQWSSLINGNSTYGLAVPFYIGSRFQDEAGNMRIDSITVDYDIDPYRKGVGTATDSGHDHGIPTMTSSNATLITSLGSGTWGENISSSWDNVLTGTVTGTTDFVYVWFTIEADGWTGNEAVSIRMVYNSNVVFELHELVVNTNYGPIALLLHMPVFASVSGVAWSLACWSIGAEDYKGSYAIYAEPTNHAHSIPSTYDTDAGNASVTIGDAVSDSGSVNATNVVVKLQFWNTGTGTWNDKVTYTPSPSKTLETDRDMSSSNTYPDALGWWRIYIVTNSATPDLIQAIVNVKHQMDN